MDESYDEVDDTVHAITIYAHSDIYVIEGAILCSPVQCAPCSDVSDVVSRPLLNECSGQGAGQRNEEASKP